MNLMERIFYRKTTSILFVTAILVLLMLVCMLLVLLTQMSSLNAKVEEYEKMIQKAEDHLITQEELLEYMQSNEYVKKWAEQRGKILNTDIQWESN